MLDLETYQVTVTMIQEQTSLVFPANVAAANPLFFNPSDKATDVGATNLPEIIPTNGPSDVLPSQDAKRPEITGRSNIFIVAAMVNAVTPERSNEWVTISNFSGEDLNLEGWTLSDTKRKALSLNGEIKAGESMRIQPLSKDGSEGVVLSNSGGTLVLADGNNRRIDSVKYGRALTEGLPVIFHMTSVE